MDFQVPRCQRELNSIIESMVPRKMINGCLKTTSPPDKNGEHKSVISPVTSGFNYYVETRV